MNILGVNIDYSKEDFENKALFSKHCRALVGGVSIRLLITTLFNSEIYVTGVTKPRLYKGVPESL